MIFIIEVFPIYCTILYSALRLWPFWTFYGNGVCVYFSHAGCAGKGCDEHRVRDMTAALVLM